MKKAKITIVPFVGVVYTVKGRDYEVIALQDTTEPKIGSYISEAQAVAFARDPKVTLIIKKGK